MDQKIAKIQTELTNELLKAEAAYDKAEASPEATKLALKALFGSLKLLTHVACNLLDLYNLNDDRLHIIMGGYEDQNKLMMATKARLDVLGRKG